MSKRRSEGVAFCECGEVSENQISSHNQFLGNGCAKCRALEKMGTNVFAYPGKSRKTPVADLPRYSLRLISDRCDEWLEGRGIPTGSAHSFIDSE